MDSQTRIGIGAAAFLTLAGIVGPITSWLICGPIMVLCAMVATWGFWPLIGRHIGRLRREGILIHEAARLAYEAAEHAGVLDLVSSPKLGAEQKLNHFKYLFMADDEAVLCGVRPPSSKSLPIPRDELARLHPAPAESTLAFIDTPSTIAYRDVTIRRRDLRRIAREYPRAAQKFLRITRPPDDAGERAVSGRNIIHRETGPNTQHGALKIEFGSGPPFETIETFQNGTKRRTTNIGIRNAGNGFLSNCHVFLSRIEPPVDRFGKLLLAGAFTLSPGEPPRYVQVAAFNEQLGTGEPGMHDRSIVLCIPPGPYFDDWFVIPADGQRARLTFEVASTDTQTVTSECWLWVDRQSTSPRLRLEAI